MSKKTCDWTVERLPWWVNGTLDEAEARSVAEHLETCAACREELTATRQAFALYAAHPAIESLLDLVAGAAGEGGAAGAPSRALVEAHVAHCAACREEVAMLRESRAAIDADEAASGTAAATVRAFLPPRQDAAPRAWGVDRRSLALAASLLLFTVAAGGWFVSGQRAERRAEQVEELERQLADAEAEIVAPPPDAPVDLAIPDPAGEPAPGEEQAALVDELRSELDRLEAELADRRPAVHAGGPILPWRVGEVLRSGEPRPEQVLEVSAGEDMANVFIDNLRETTYRVTLEDADGRLLFPLDGLRPETSPQLGSYLLLEIGLADLPPGDLRLRLFAGGEPVDSIVLRRAP